jgi:DNA-binding response OmpR family regulator
VPEAIRVAVVEDEADLREVVVEWLRAQGIAALPCPDAAALDAALAEAPVAAVLLDLNLPREGGLSIARRLRDRPDRPGILMVTARGEPTDRIVGLELGADDCIGKPFELRELLARLRGSVWRLGKCDRTFNWTRFTATIAVKRGSRTASRDHDDLAAAPAAAALEGGDDHRRHAADPVGIPS